VMPSLGSLSVPSRSKNKVKGPRVDSFIQQSTNPKHASSRRPRTPGAEAGIMSISQARSTGFGELTLYAVTGRDKYVPHTAGPVQALHA
jgi:hypothetical protein